MKEKEGDLISLVISGGLVSQLETLSDLYPDMSAAELVRLAVWEAAQTAMTEIEARDLERERAQREAGSEDWN